jgi:GT2 family glycosyltransferase
VGLQECGIRVEYKKDFISVIVAVRNEEQFISSCIHALMCQKFPKDQYRIVIVDGMSDDKTRDIVKELMKIYPQNIILLENPDRWQSAGRNLGIINERNSDYIAYIDGHCLADEDWLASLYDLMRECGGNIAGVGSVLASPKDEVLIGKAIDLIFSTSLGGMGSSYRPQKQVKDVRTVPFVLYRRKALEEVNYYDEDLRYGEDYSLNYKLRAKGYKLLVNPKAIVYYYKRRSLLAFFKQMYNYGVTKAIIAKRYPSSLSIVHVMPSLVLLFMVLIIIASLMLNRTLLVVPTFVLSAYVLVILVTSGVHIVQRRAFRYLKYMPFLFILEHFGYSTGFLVGFIKKGWTQ